jgi:acylglycerol lipase
MLGRMTHVEGTFTGAAGDEIYWQGWRPDTPRALVLLAHGLHEHSGRYTWVAEQLVAAGYAVYTVDHEGHGRSGGTKANIGSMKVVLDDFASVREIARRDVPDVPLFVMGHSMGGLIALDYVTDRGEAGITGLVLSGAAVDTSTAGGLQSKLAPIVGKIAPNLGVLLLGADNVSRDPAVVKDYENDALNYNGKVRARTGAEMLRSVQRVVERMPRLRLPVLVMHGTEDKLVPSAGSQLINDTVGSPDKTLRMYDGLYHEIFNEPEKEQVLADVVAWLDAHVATGGGPA